MRHALARPCFASLDRVVVFLHANSCTLLFRDSTSRDLAHAALKEVPVQGSSRGARHRTSIEKKGFAQNVMLYATRRVTAHAQASRGRWPAGTAEKKRAKGKEITAATKKSYSVQAWMVRLVSCFAPSTGPQVAIIRAGTSGSALAAGRSASCRCARKTRVRGTPSAQR